MQKTIQTIIALIITTTSVAAEPPQTSLRPVARPDIIGMHPVYPGETLDCEVEPVCELALNEEEFIDASPSEGEAEYELYYMSPDERDDEGEIMRALIRALYSDQGESA